MIEAPEREEVRLRQDQRIPLGHACGGQRIRPHDGVGVCVGGVGSGEGVDVEVRQQRLMDLENDLDILVPEGRYCSTSTLH